MKVYVVSWQYAWEEVEPIAVFSEKAVAEEYLRWHAAATGDGELAYGITERTLDERTPFPEPVSDK